MAGAHATYHIMVLRRDMALHELLPRTAYVLIACISCSSGITDGTTKLSCDSRRGTNSQRTSTCARYDYGAI